MRRRRTRRRSRRSASRREKGSEGYAEKNRVSGGDCRPAGRDCSGWDFPCLFYRSKDGAKHVHGRQREDRADGAGVDGRREAGSGRPGGEGSDRDEHRAYALPCARSGGGAAKRGTGLQHGRRDRQTGRRLVRRRGRIFLLRAAAASRRGDGRAVRRDRTQRRDGKRRRGNDACRHRHGLRHADAGRAAGGSGAHRRGEPARGAGVL